MRLNDARQHGKMNSANRSQHKGGNKKNDGGDLACNLEALCPKPARVLRVRHREPF